MKVLLFLAAMVVSSYGIFVCPPGVCTGIKCANVTNCAGIVDPKGGLCQCCPVCVRQLEVGQNCAMTLLFGRPHIEECAVGLICSKLTQVCEKMTCGMVLVKLLAEHKGVLGLPVPTCTASGDYYTAVQCRGAGCFCAALTGEPIPVYKANIWESKEMTCNCARDQSNYRQSGSIDKFFFCTPNGNYMKVQCTASECFCADKTGKPTSSKRVPVSMANTLIC